MLALITTTEATSLIQTFNWHTPSWDLFIILFWAVASIFYAFSSGRGRVISMLMSLYVAKLIVSEAPWITQAVNQKLTGNLVGLQQLVSFVLIFIVLFIFLARFAFKTSVDGKSFISIPFVFVFAVLQVGLLINTILTYLSQAGNEFSPLVTTLFLANGASFIWLVLPLAFLIVLGNFISDRGEA